MLLAMAVSANAQQIDYKVFSNEVNFTAVQDGERLYWYNMVEISLPTKSSESLPLEAISQSILSTSFELLDDHITNNLTTTEAVKAYMQTRNLSPDLPEDNIKRCNKIPDDEMAQFTEVKVTPQCLENGLLTMCRETSVFYGGTHPYHLTSYFYIDIRTGKLVSEERLLTNNQKKAALRLLSSTANVKKYHNNADYTYDNQDAAEIATGIRDLENDVESFPPFYVKNNRVYMIFPQYAVCSYATGMPEFIIPLSALTATATTPVKRPAAKTTSRPAVRRR